MSGRLTYPDPKVWEPEASGTLSLRLISDTATVSAELEEMGRLFRQVAHPPLRAISCWLAAPEALVDIGFADLDEPSVEIDALLIRARLTLGARRVLDALRGGATGSEIETLLNEEMAR